MQCKLGGRPAESCHSSISNSDDSDSDGSRDVEPVVMLMIINKLINSSSEIALS